MRWNCIKKYVAGLGLCILLAGCIGGIPVKAGSSDLVVDSHSFEKELDTMLWNATDNRVNAKDGTLVFSKESKKSTALITKMIANHTGYHDELVRVATTMDLSGIPEGKTFTVALGLGSIEAIMGEPGNVELQFTRQGTVKASVVVYDMDNQKTELVAPQTVSSLSNVKMEAEISSESVLTFSVNGKQVCSEKLPVSGEGRVGFLQSGSCAVTIKDADIVAHRYDRPENCDIYEDFEKESININSLTAKMVFVSGHYVPYGMEIQNMDGNRVMEFKNMNGAYLGSMYQYSNFELTFDVLGMQRVSEFDEKGNEIVPKNGSIVVSFGDEAADYDSWGYETSPDAVVFYTDSQVYSMNQGHKQDAGQKGYDYSAAEVNKDFTIRVSVIDGLVTASMKWIDEDVFTEILKYKVSDETPLGYVHIWGVGEKATNFSVDNVSLVNKDTEPNLVEVEFKSAVPDVPEDFVYEKIGYVYRDTADTEEKKQFSPYLAIPVVAVVCAGAFGVALLVTKGKRKEETSNA